MVDLTDKYLSQKWYDEAGGLMNPNFAFLVNEMASYNTFVLCGGTRSGKTFAVLQYIWGNLSRFNGAKYTIARQSMPVLKGTIIPDFKEIGYMANLYNVSNHNQTEQVYKQNGNELSFVAGENEDKLRGLKQDFLYVNEAPELGWDSIQQLLFRTSSKRIFDYNPSYPDSWMYDKILSRDNVAFIRTTYKDNPFVSETQLEELEWMKEHDPQRYLIYGLGQRGEIQGQIYHNFRKIRDDQFPEDANIWVLDFGFSDDPSAIMQLKFEGRTIYAKERLYKTGQSNLDLIIHLYFAGFNENKGHMLIADSADPQNIAEIRYGLELTDDFLMDEIAKLGYSLHSERKYNELKEMISGINIIGAIKGPGSIRAGIKKVQSFEVLLTEGSINAWSEVTNYKYKMDRFTGRPTREPVDKFNHCMDCIRYAGLAEGRYFFTNAISK